MPVYFGSDSTPYNFANYNASTYTLTFAPNTFVYFTFNGNTTSSSSPSLYVNYVQQSGKPTSGDVYVYIGSTMIDTMHLWSNVLIGATSGHAPCIDFLSNSVEIYYNTGSDAINDTYPTLVLTTPMQYSSFVTNTHYAAFNTSSATLSTPGKLYLYVDSTNTAYFTTVDPIGLSCFTHRCLRTIALSCPSIIVKNVRPDHIPIYKIGDYELTYNHAIMYNGRYTTWQHYVDDQCAITQCEQPACKYLYNILGHPSQQHVSNIVAVSKSLTIYSLGGENSARIWSHIITLYNNNIAIEIIENIDDIDDTHDIKDETYYLYIPKWSTFSPTKQRMIMSKVINTMHSMQVFLRRRSIRLGGK